MLVTLFAHSPALRSNFDMVGEIINQGSRNKHYALSCTLIRLPENKLLFWFSSRLDHYLYHLALSDTYDYLGKMFVDLALKFITRSSESLSHASFAIFDTTQARR